MITVNFSGFDVEQVDEEVSTYFKHWPSAGYNTKIDQQYTTATGKKVVVVKRWDNCD